MIKNGGKRMAKKGKAIEIVIQDEKGNTIRSITWDNHGNGYDDEDIARAIKIIERGKNVLNYRVFSL
jgi:hypothetical protein